MSAETPFAIRAAIAQDAREFARLFDELGHPSPEDSIRTRWPEWERDGNHALVADRGDGTLLGVATLHAMMVLHRPRPVGRITALVVDQRWRGQGIGRRLVAAAEDALTRSGCGLLEITSNLSRADAHAFYERLGYERTSLRFKKTLAE